MCLVELELPGGGQPEDGLPDIPEDDAPPLLPPDHILPDADVLPGVPPADMLPLGTKEPDIFTWHMGKGFWCITCNEGLEPSSLYRHLFTTKAHKKGKAKVTKEMWAGWASKADWLNHVKGRLPT